MPGQRSHLTGAIDPLILQISDPPKEARYSRQPGFFRNCFPSQPIPKDSLSDAEFSGRFSVALFRVFSVTAQRFQNFVGGHAEKRSKTENAYCLFI
jgi:hypothetical protein